MTAYAALVAEDGTGALGAINKDNPLHLPAYVFLQMMADNLRSMRQDANY